MLQYAVAWSRGVRGDGVRATLNIALTLLSAPNSGSNRSNWYLEIRQLTLALTAPLRETVRWMSVHFFEGCPVEKR
jgi:hypothetical protein